MVGGSAHVSWDIRWIKGLQEIQGGGKGVIRARLVSRGVEFGGGVGELVSW